MIRNIALRSRIRAGLSLLVLAAAGLLIAPAPGYSEPQGAERRQDRQDARDTKQEGRDAARDAKAECKAGDDKTRAECRQEKRKVKQDSREAARDIKKND